MATSRVTVKGNLTADGKVQIDLPNGWVPGEIDVELLVEGDAESSWTEEELQELEQYFEFKGSTLGDIPDELIGAGADWDIGDSAEWVAEQRRKRAEKSHAKWTV